LRRAAIHLHAGLLPAATLSRFRYADDARGARELGGQGGAALFARLCRLQYVMCPSRFVSVLSSTGSLAALTLFCAAAFAWGDEGHEVIGLIADHYLEPGVRSRVHVLLAMDASGLTAKDIAHESTWADKYRDSDRDTTKVRYDRTRNWHFVDLELD